MGTPPTDSHGECRGVDIVCGTTKGGEALQDLGGVFLFVEVDGQEHVVRLEV
jgi:hypothetical protein